MATSFAFMTLSATSILLILLLGMLLFGRNLPVISKNLAKGFREFRNGLSGIEDEIDTGHNARRQDHAALDIPHPPQRVGTMAPKFEESAGSMQQPPAVQQQNSSNA